MTLATCSKLRTWLGIATFLLFVVNPAMAFQPVQVTSNPGEDFAPSVSPDGRFMVYVSDTSGNLDLWMKYLGAGIQPPDRRLTFHTSEDKSPAISPDGKYVAFVSHRGDPRGDIYILNLEEKSDPIPVFQGKGEDLDPAWSADQKLIYFGSRSNGVSIFKIDWTNGQKSLLLKEGGINLSTSTDGDHLAFVTGNTQSNLKVLNLKTNSVIEVSGGAEIDVSPSWFNNTLFFARYSDDTNGDGQLAIDDNPNIWRLDVINNRAENLRQLTDSSTYDFFPYPGPQNTVLYSSHQKGSVDIWQLPQSGRIPLENNFGDSLKHIEIICEEVSYLCAMALSNQIRQFPNAKGLAEIRFRLAVLNRKLNHPETARKIFGQILESHGDNQKISGLSEIEILLLDIKKETAPSSMEIKKAVSRVDSIMTEFSGITRIQARGLLEKGKLFLMEEAPDKALKYFQEVIGKYSKARDLAAEAAFLQSRIYKLVGNQEKLVQSFVQVVRDFPDVLDWKQKAVEEILNLHEKQPSLEKKVSRLQVLTETYKDIPSLAAAIQNRIGSLYYEATENLLAKEAYKNTIKSFQKAQDQSFKARFELAKIYAEEENFDESLIIYEKISKETSTLETYRARAVDGQIKKALEKGNWELRVGEIKLAAKTFLRLIEFSPETVEAHRGYLQATSALKKNEPAVKLYQERVKKNPDSAVELYSLGLAYTYLDPPALEEAEAEISRALSKNSQQVFFHQTLGWIYEQKERQQTGFLEKALHEYQIALALNDENTNLRNEADLLLNLGNGHYSLNNPLSARHYYRKRDETGLEFLNSDREALYRQRYGEASFKAGDSGNSIKQFKKALKIIRKTKNLSRMAELHDRIALAYQEKEDFDLAVKHFSQSLELNRQAGNQPSLSRALRNIANNIYSQNRLQPDSEKMSQALGYYYEAIDKLERYGVADRKKKSSALLEVNIEAGLGEDVSAAAHGFDKTGEQKLIFHYIGKIYGDFGNNKKAIEYFQKKLALIPGGLDVDKNIPVLLEKALLLNQLGNYFFQAGNSGKSLQFFKESFALAKKLDNRNGMAVNAANMAHVVFTLGGRDGFSKEMEEVIGFLQTAIPSTQPASSVVLHNYLGILFHIQAFNSSKPTLVKSNEIDLVKSGFESLRQSSSRIKQSIHHFETALKLATGDAKKYWPGIKQNLELTRSLAGVKGGNAPWSPPPAIRWQFVYLDSLRLEGSKRLARLMDAERELSRLPYGAISSDRSVLAMVEQLYRKITSNLFEQKKYKEAFLFSEKGKKLITQALAPTYQFSSEERMDYFNEIGTYAEKLPSLEGEEAESLLDEYHEFVEMAQEDDPVLVDWISPDVPPLEVLQSLLGKDEIFLKFQRQENHVLVWQVNREKISAGRISGGKSFFQSVQRLVHSGANPGDIEILSKKLIAPLKDALGNAESIILLPEGRLEFLPWAALELNGKALIEKAKLTFVSSLPHFIRSVNLRNLYGSRLLALESNLPENIEKVFASVENLKGDEASRKTFLENWNHFSLVHIESPARFFRHEPDSSFISLNKEPGKFQRVSVESLYSNPVESHLFSLAEVEHEFDPRLELSPTTVLLQGLTFKGYPGVLLHSGKPEFQQEFNEVFTATLSKGSPAESLRQAQIALAKKHPGNLDWARYQYYGFPGMNEAEKQKFAISHIKSNVLKGAAASQSGNFISTINFLEKALVLAPFVPEKTDLGENFQAKTILKALATAAFKVGDFEKSIHYQKKVLPFAEKEEDPEELADVHYFLGLLYSLAEKFPQSVKHLKTALAIFEEYEILDRLAQSYSQLGIVEENAAEYSNALKAFTASEKINEEIGEDLNRGRELRRIGKIYSLRLNQFKEAKKYFSKAYDLFVDLEQKELQVELLLDLGLVAEKEGNFERSLGYFSRAQVLAEKNNFKEGLSKSFLYQANSHWFQGDYQNAFRAQRQSLEIAKALNDKLRQAFIYNTLGLIHWTLNDPERALKNLKLSLDLATEMHSPIDIASAYNNIGLVHRKEKRYEKSIESFKESLERDIQLKTKWGQGYTHRNMGMSLMRMGKLDEAAGHFNQAMGFSSEIGDRTNVVKIMLELGHLALERKQWEEALQHFDKTHALSSKINVKEVSWRALRGKGFALVQLKQNDAAVKAYKDAVKTVDAMRAAIKVEEFQNGFLTDKQDVYKELILLLLDMGQIEDSFQYAERAKSRSFIDLLGNQKISLKNDVSQKLYDALTGQKILIREIEESFAAARADEKEEEAKELSQKLVEARRSYQNLLIEAKEQSPEISNFITVDAITLKQLYGLLEDNVALVEYLVTKKELVAWIVKKGKIDSIRVPVDENDLNELIADYRGRIQKLAPVEEQSRRLHALLVKPVEAFIKDKRILGIVPHGHLHYISFSSLKDEESYLFERHPLFYSPSASVMQFTFKQIIERSRDIKVLALGNPDLGDMNYDLPLAEMEANAIKWDFPKIDVLTRENATESWLKKNIGGYQVIHVASHGEFDPINPLFSSLKLTRDKSDDGNFEVNEVFGLNIKADIVTLSACQTGLGDLVGGDELVGLNRAFIYAGTHSILSSLWRVSDISTAVLIKHFYRNYGKKDKAESLRQAQLLVKRLYPHPSYWAGFNLTGDYR
ncbi:MAG: CHAT domain-containing protein [Nitrospinae bacterium]|nr:CHAT domain-containing protein [Nitrospinota bacterium]